MNIDANQIIDKLTKRISLDAKTIAAYEVTIETLQSKLSEYEEGNS